MQRKGKASSDLFENQARQPLLLFGLDPEAYLSQISLVSPPATATSSGIMRALALLVFILLALLSISLSQSQGFGTNAAYLISRGHRLQPNKPSHHQENMKIRREMKEFEISDYEDPKANVNPRSGPLLNPPNPTPPPSY